MTPLPEEILTPRLLLRTWRLADADALAVAVRRSLAHLQPWMPWAAGDQHGAGTYQQTIKGFQAEWAAGGDVVYGVFAGDAVVGGCGLRGRRGPGVLEIGYWIHVDHTGRGYATELAAALTDAAFTVDGVDRVEIHHDRANAASRGVPARLSFRFEGEHAKEILAPGEEGIDCTWAVSRADWVRRLTDRSVTTR